jgi:thimet oligopeptidase
MTTVASAALCATPDEFARGCREELARARACARRARLAPPGDAVAVLEAWDAAVAALSDAAARASLARNVHPDPGLREAAERCEQEVDALSTELSLDRGLHRAIAALDVSAEDAPTRWLVKKALRDFRRAGVDRDDATRARLKALRDELLRVGQEFGRNIKDDVRRLQLELSELEGLPQDWLRTHPPGPDGRVTVTTDAADYVPFVTWARSARAREALWRLHRLRGYPRNLEVLSRLLTLRAELAGLLGYPSWAAYVTEDKMIGGAEAAAAFVERIASASEGRLRDDLRELLAMKRRDQPGAERVEPWDSAWLQERVRTELHGFDGRAVRPYLEYRAVRDGVLDVAARLFGLRFVALRGVPAWHPEVEVYEVVEGETPVGRIHLDMFPREGKYRHFAQFTLASGQAGRRLPEGVLVCNFPRPAVGAPALLDHGEVRTLFHEFGHLLHHVLGGGTRWAAHSGVATEWDFVEAPSQLLEEWAWDPGVLRGFARHVETGEPIPEELMARMRAADGYGKGLLVRQQTFYAAVSLELHRRDPAGLDTTALVAELQERYTPFPHVPGTAFQAGFGHLDGYSAVYYTYLWSLVIAKDLARPFRQAGLMDPGVARSYRRAVLEPGGSKPAQELVRDFLGRPHAFEAFEAWLAA